MSDIVEKDSSAFATSCKYCERNFTQYKNLYAHIRRFHKDKPIFYRQKSMILCSICDEEQHKIKAYWDHIYWKHPEVNLCFEKLFFYSEEDFDNWRLEIEARTHTHYLSARSKHVMSDGRIIQQYQCDRSGFYRKRFSCDVAHARRFSGSKKIGKFCPAYIYRTTTIEGDLMEIEVNFQSTHAGHKFDLHSLRIRSAQRERRLRSKGKGRWPKKIKNPPPSPSSDVKNESKDLDKKSKSFMTEIADILLNDSNLEVQQVSCTCEEYTMQFTCEHVQEILNGISEIKSIKPEANVVNESDISRGINEIKSITPEANVVNESDISRGINEIKSITPEANVVNESDISRGINEIKSITPEANVVNESDISTGSPCVVSDLTTTMADLTTSVEDVVNPITKDSSKALEDEKASILEEFLLLVNMCQSSEQLKILKKNVLEGKKRLFPTEDTSQESLHTFVNLDSSQLIPLTPYALLGAIPASGFLASGFHASSLPLPGRNNVVVLKQSSNNIKAEIISQR